MMPGAWLGVVIMLLLMSPYVAWNVYAGLAARRRSRSPESGDRVSESSCVVVCGLKELAPR